MADSPYCCACEVRLADRSQRRSLNPVAGKSNERAVHFLKTSVGFTPSPSQYMCVKCFKQVEKGYQSLHVAKDIINSMSKLAATSSNVPDTVLQTPEASTGDAADGMPSPSRPKRARRSLLSHLNAQSTSSSNSPAVQVIHFHA